MNNDRKTERTSRRVEVTNPDGMTTTYWSISQAAKARSADLRVDHARQGENF